MSEEINKNIASHLPKMAESNPFTPAVIFPEGRDRGGRVSYTHYTLRQLNEESGRIAQGLEKVGIRRGTRTALMVTPSLDFFALTFGIFKTGAVPILIDPGIGIKNMKKCLGEAKPEAFIGLTKAHAARVLLGWAQDSIKILVTVGRKLFWGGYTLEEISEMGRDGKNYKTVKMSDEDPAAILFTSGSTGVSKGALYTHGIFNEQVASLKRIYNITPGERDLATFPLFALFGPALGMTAIIPDMDASRPADADPKKLVETIEDFGATNMFASPALLGNLGRYCEKNNIKLPSLKRIISAGAPASTATLRKFSNVLGEGIDIFTPYGATESLPVASIGSREILEKTAKMTDEGKGSCVGKPVPNITLKIIKISDDPIEKWSDDLELPQGEIGEITVKGPVVTREYFNREEATKLAKIIEPGGGLWHRMGDVGYIDGEFRVWFCGRKAHRVILSDEETLYTIPTEAVFNTHPKVFRTALVGVKKDGSTIPVLWVELEKSAKNEDQQKVKKELLELGSKYPHTEKVKTILFHESFPVDVRHNAKIFREKLTVMAGSEV